jgi:hypothetical protein
LEEAMSIRSFHQHGLTGDTYSKLAHTQKRTTPVVLFCCSFLSWKNWYIEELIEQTS